MMAVHARPDRSEIDPEGGHRHTNRIIKQVTVQFLNNTVRSYSNHPQRGGDRASLSDKRTARHSAGSDAG